MPRRSLGPQDICRASRRCRGLCSPYEAPRRSAAPLALALGGEAGRGLPGGLISVGYVVAGVPRPALFGALTVACAMVRLGAWIAFTLTWLFLLAQVEVAAAVGLIAYGAAVALLGDYVIQPTLIGGSTRLPFLWPRGNPGRRRDVWPRRAYLSCLSLWQPCCR
ncbi:MAG: hypothetical protein QOF70_6263 [Acetobacteraceae bacterium]|nr:hypothetical protein [Acetobacteraceae bacterium]